MIANTSLSDLTSGWHHFVGTYDGFSTKIYIDGVLEGTNAAYTTKTPIFYNANNGMFIGAEAAGSLTSPYGTYFKGKMSDVRIYATALSDEDILELYNTSAFITDNGTTECYEFDEIDDELSINKNGIMKIGNLYESSAEYTEDVYFTGTGGTYKPSANANNQCETFYIVYSNV